jgi:hypothetical protein
MVVTLAPGTDMHTDTSGDHDHCRVDHRLSTTPTSRKLLDEHVDWLAARIDSR